MIEYNGYVAVVEFDEELDSFHGTVVNTNDVITFYGRTVDELREEMKKSVEVYVDFCEEQGRAPEKPFSGNLVIRTTPDLHRRIALTAARRNQSMNAFVQELLEKGVSGE